MTSIDMASLGTEFHITLYSCEVNPVLRYTENLLFSPSILFCLSKNCNMHSEVVWGYVKISSIPWIPWRKSLVGACMGVRQSLFS